MEYSLIDFLWFFIIYGFLGWCVEVAFQTVNKGIFINRGFLNGPICPIYGFGMIILLYILGPIADSVLLLFIGSFFLTSLLEYITGFILEKVFDDKWWDYSDKPFNIKGYISLSFSLMWALGSIFMIEIIHPFIYRFVSFFDNKMGNYILIGLFLGLGADFIVTVIGILKIHKRFRLLEAISNKLHSYSEEVGEGIYKQISKTMKFADKVQSKIQESKLDIETAFERDKDIRALKEKYNKLIKEKHFVERRLEKSYPNIKKRIDEYREKISEYREKRL